jgi:hypothetical protein
MFVNIYDFGRRPVNKDTGEKQEASVPKIDAGVKVGLRKWLYAGVAIEDAVEKAGIMPYVRIELDDDDIARILGIMGVAVGAAK